MINIIITAVCHILGFPDGSAVKNPPECRRRRRHRFDPWVRKIPWRWKWQPTPVFLPGKSHGQRILTGCSSRGCRESDMAELLSRHKRAVLEGFPWWLSGKEPTCQYRRLRFDSSVGKILWERECQPPAVFLPGKSQGQKNLAGYSPRVAKEVDIT